MQTLEASGPFGGGWSKPRRETNDAHRLDVYSQVNPANRP